MSHIAKPQHLRLLLAIALATLLFSIGFSPALEKFRVWPSHRHRAAVERATAPYQRYLDEVWYLTKAAGSTSPDRVRAAEPMALRLMSQGYTKDLAIPRHPKELVDFLLEVDEVAHYGSILLGRAALLRGDLPEARERLLCAASIAGTPHLAAYGPDMTLAQELLKVGERDVVLEYLVRSRSFWRDARKSADWYDSVRLGVLPDFGNNSGYTRWRPPAKK